MLLKFTKCEKVVFTSKAVVSVYVNLQMNIHRPGALWKTPVDNVVDNVENSELSTGIPLLFRILLFPSGTAYYLAYFRNYRYRRNVTSLISKLFSSSK